MKKSMFLIGFVLISSSLYAQLSIGLRAGINFANQTAKVDGNTETGDTKIGFLGGTYLTANLSEKIAIQPELLFSSMGSQDKDADYKMPFNYISVPVLLRFNVSEQINIHAGPQAGFLLSAKITDGGNSVDMKEFFTGTDFGLAIGIGADFDKINAGVRYYAGLSNIAEDATGDDSYKNSAFQVFLGYRIFGGE